MKQEELESIIEGIGRPFTIRDVLEELVRLKIVNETIDKKYRIRANVSKLLQRMKAWGTVDRLPQGHSIDQMPIWYLKKNGDPHELPCQICTDRDRCFGRRYRQMMIRYYSRRTKISPGKDEYDEASYQGGPMI